MGRIVAERVVKTCCFLVFSFSFVFFVSLERKWCLATWQFNEWCHMCTRIRKVYALNSRRNKGTIKAKYKFGSFEKLPRWNSSHANFWWELQTNDQDSKENRWSNRHSPTTIFRSLYGATETGLCNRWPLTEATAKKYDLMSVMCRQFQFDYIV